MVRGREAGFDFSAGTDVCRIDRTGGLIICAKIRCIDNCRWLILYWAVRGEDVNNGRKPYGVVS